MTAKTIKVGINGMGRIGRTILREFFKSHGSSNQTSNIDIVAINNPGDPLEYAHLLKYDSIHGVCPFDINLEGQILNMGGKKIHFFTQKNPAEIAWDRLGVEIVIDATGVFKDHSGLSLHKKGSVKKVIMCAPGKDLDGTFVMGINHHEYDNSKHHIVSNASCTTNCLAPVAKILHENFGIVNAFMATVHAYTSDQQLLDGSHRDRRRARAAGVSMIPTTTGAAKTVGVVIPELKGKLDGHAIRVPTSNVSMVDLTVNFERDTTVEAINQAIREASENKLKGILKYTEEELVSVDYLGMRESSCFDAKLTAMLGTKTAHIVAWYDNETGFSNRVIDLAGLIASKL